MPDDDDSGSDREQYTLLALAEEELANEFNKLFLNFSRYFPPIFESFKRKLYDYYIAI